MTKAFPKKLKIGAHTYTVREIEFPNDGYGFEDGTQGRSEILIRKGLCRTQKIATLLHEIMGASNATMHGDQVLHALVEAQAQQLAQVLIDNNLITI